MALAISIRAARPADYEALAELWSALDALHAQLHPTFFTEPPPRRPRSALTATLAHRARHLLVAAREPDQRIVGAAQLALHDTPAQPQMVSALRAHLEELVVAPAARRRGIGRALMAAAEEWARSRGARHLVLTVWTGNDEAAAFYRALGYAELNTVLGCALDPV